MKSFRLPGLDEVVGKSGGHENQQKNAPHGFDSVDTDVFHVEIPFQLMCIGLLEIHRVDGDDQVLYPVALNGRLPYRVQSRLQCLGTRPFVPDETI